MNRQRCRVLAVAAGALVLLAAGPALAQMFGGPMSYGGPGYYPYGPYSPYSYTVRPEFYSDSPYYVTPFGYYGYVLPNVDPGYYATNLTKYTYFAKKYREQRPEPIIYYNCCSAPKPQERPPQPAGYGEMRDTALTSAKLNWTKDGELDVRWQARQAAVTLVEFEFTDQAGVVVGYQEATRTPFDFGLDIPEDAVWLRVTVHYADGALTSSAISVRR